MGQDFRAQLADQLALMRIAADAFDAGQEVAAKQLATSIRLLVHDARSTSLLTHLGVKLQLPYRDTALAEAPPGVITVNCGLCMFNLNIGSQEVTYRPPLDELSVDRQHPPACFEDWWRIPVLRDTAGHQFSRASFVLTVANKDGGTHVDGVLPSDYEALTRANSLGFAQVATGEPNTAALSVCFEGLRQAPHDGRDGSEPVPNSIALASVRQIAHELVSTLETELVDAGNSISVREPICPLPFADQPSAGRNDPCPCGGGRKFKHCFGQRRPRRRAELPPQELPPLA